MIFSRKEFLKILGLGLLSVETPGGFGFASEKIEASKAQAKAMKVKAVDIFYFDIPLKGPFRISIGTAYAANDVLIRIETDSGLVGLGEACPFPPITGETQETNVTVAKNFRDMIIGKNPLAIESILREFGSFVHTNPSMVAAFDMVLYDILGKTAGIPLFRLLGGDKSCFETDLTVDLDTPENMAKTAKGFVGRGFKIIKVKVGQGIDVDVARLQAIRDAIGYDPQVRIDANQGWTVPQAITALKQMEKFKVQFVEQPVAAWDLAGLKSVRLESPIPVMADEALFLPSDAIKLIKAEACDYFNIKLMKAGGIMNSLKIAQIAESANIQCMIGCMLETRLGLTAAAHLCAAQQTITFADLDGFNSHTIDPVIDGMAVKEGMITLPELPGLGVDIDPVFLKKLRKV